jgi:hypothetical protein
LRSPIDHHEELLEPMVILFALSPQPRPGGADEATSTTAAVAAARLRGLLLL